MKGIPNARRHLPRTGHKHFYSTIDALTLGYVRELPIRGGSRVGIGGDITLYGMSADLVEYFEGSRSYHAFIRWRPASAAAHIH